MYLQAFRHFALTLSKHLFVVVAVVGGGGDCGCSGGGWAVGVAQCVPSRWICRSSCVVVCVDVGSNHLMRLAAQL